MSAEPETPPLKRPSPGEGENPLELSASQHQKIAKIYLSELTREQQLHTYQELRCHYTRELLSQAVLRMSKRVLLVAGFPLYQRSTCSPHYLREVVKGMLMNDLEIAVMTYFLKKQNSEEESTPIELLILLCSYHAKSIMTQEITPIRVFLEAKFPLFTTAKYSSWIQANPNMVLDPKQLNRLYIELTKRTEISETAVNYGKWVDFLSSSPETETVSLDKATQTGRNEPTRAIEYSKLNQLVRNESLLERANLNWTEESDIKVEDLGLEPSVSVAESSLGMSRENSLF